MSRNSSKLLAFLLISVLALSAFGVTYAQTEPTKMRLTWWGSQSRHDRTIAVVEMYEKANPGIDIVFEFANFNDYWTLLNTQAAAGELPCVMQHDYAYLAEWAKRGLLQSLNPFVEKGIIDLSSVADTAIAGGRVGDQLYGLSLGTNSQAIILDVDAFEKAGVALPDPKWTWTDFEKIAHELHEKLGIYAYGSPSLGDDQIWTGMMVANGYLPFNETNTDLGYDDDKPLADHFNMLLRLQTDGVIMPLEEMAAQAASGPEASPIVTSKAAMQYQWSNQVVAIFKAAGENRHFKLWHMPRPEGKGAANYLKPSMFFAIPTACTMPEEAAKFINFFTNNPEANDILLAERGVPISAAIREHLQPKLDTTGKETFDFLGRVEKDSSPIFPPNPPGYNDLRNNVWNPQVHDPILYGQISVEEGLKILRSEAKAILGKNK